MSISFGGISSGLPVDDIISQLMDVERRPINLMQQRIVDLNLNKAQYTGAGERSSTLLDTLKKLTAQSVLDQNLFELKSATSSNEAVATATADESASSQNIKLEVINLASQTTAQSLAPVGSLITGVSPLSDLAQGNVSNGDFTVFVDGVASTVTVDNTQDVNSVLTQISGIAGITGASVVGGQIQVSFGAGTNIQLGGNGDTSNFLDVSFLKTGTQTATDITGSSVLSGINLGADVGTAAANIAAGVVTAGTFTIGTATFDTTGKNLGTLISEINDSADANVTASFNLSQNRLELISKETGSAMINLADGTSDFLTKMGLVSGVDTTAAQTAGNNAQIVLNGSTIFSSSNTVTAGLTGLTGVTLELTGITTGTPIDIDIAQDNTELASTLADFVAQVNGVISFIDEQTDSQNDNAALKGESGLRRFRDQLRRTTSDAVAGLTVFSSLGFVGISTGAVTGTAGAASTFQFDEAAFTTALAQNPSEVRALMTGTGGIFTQLESIVDGALRDDPDATLDGLFVSHGTSIQNRVDSINDQIERAEIRLERRESLLRQQFTVMEQLIAQSQNQGNALAGLANQLSSNANG